MSGAITPRLALGAAGRWLSLGGLLLASACQPADNHTQRQPTKATEQPAAPAPAPAPTPGAPTTSAPLPPPMRTLYPDTLRPRLLEVSYWRDGQLDSTQAELDSAEVGRPYASQKGRFRTLDLSDGHGQRFLYRPEGQATGWTELDLSAWLSEFNAAPFLEAREADLDQQGPKELLLQTGGGVYGSGGGNSTTYTFIISVAGPPTLIWQSVDFCEETVKPTSQNAEGEMEGGNAATASRDVTVRRRLVCVGQVKREGKFEFTEDLITPITPGCYRYQAGRFRWVKR